MTTGSLALAADGGSYTFADTVAWDATYDAVVLGMGFAGMTAAMPAAGAGASVLICEKAPGGEAGGGSRVSSQMFANTSEDADAALAYSPKRTSPPRRTRCPTTPHSRRPPAPRPVWAMRQTWRPAPTQRAPLPTPTTTLSGSAKGMGGQVPVTVTLDADGKIASVEVGKNAETEGTGSRAIEQMPGWIRGAFHRRRNRRHLRRHRHEQGSQRSREGSADL